MLGFEKGREEKSSRTFITSPRIVLKWTMDKSHTCKNQSANRIRVWRLGASRSWRLQIWLNMGRLANEVA